MKLFPALFVSAFLTIVSSGSPTGYNEEPSWIRLSADNALLGSGPPAMDDSISYVLLTSDITAKVSNVIKTSSGSALHPITQKKTYWAAFSLSDNANGSNQCSPALRLLEMATFSDTKSDALIKRWVWSDVSSLQSGAIPVLVGAMIHAYVDGANGAPMMALVGGSYCTSGGVNISPYSLNLATMIWTSPTISPAVAGTETYGSITSYLTSMGRIDASIAWMSDKILMLGVSGSFAVLDFSSQSTLQAVFVYKLSVSGVDKPTNGTGHAMLMLKPNILILSGGFGCEMSKCGVAKQSVWLGNLTNAATGYSKNFSRDLEPLQWNLINFSTYSIGKENVTITQLSVTLGSTSANNVSTSPPSSMTYSANTSSLLSTPTMTYMSNFSSTTIIQAPPQASVYVSAVPSLGRYRHSMVSLNDGNLLMIFGGYIDNAGNLAKQTIFLDMLTMIVWSTTLGGALPNPRVDCALVSSNNTVALTGGKFETSSLSVSMNDVFLMNVTGYLPNTTIQSTTDSSTQMMLYYLIGGAVLGIVFIVTLITVCILRRRRRPFSNNKEQLASNADIFLGHTSLGSTYQMRSSTANLISPTHAASNTSNKLTNSFLRASSTGLNDSPNASMEFYENNLKRQNQPKKSLTATGSQIFDVTSRKARSPPVKAFTVDSAPLSARSKASLNELQTQEDGTIIMDAHVVSPSRSATYQFVPQKLQILPKPNNFTVQHIAKNQYIPKPGASNQYHSEQVQAQKQQDVPSTAPGSNQATTDLMGTMVTENQGYVLSLPGFRQLKDGLDYRVGEQINSSGEGIIYSGQLLNGNMVGINGGESNVVIKCPKPKASSEDDEFTAHFQQEIAIIWLMNKHKNIVKLVGYSDNPPSVLLKRYPYGSLKDVTHTKKTSKYRIKTAEWAPDLLVALAFDVATGIMEIHKLGIIHNDLKTANVLVDDDGPPGSLFAVLTDFGIASIVNKALLGVKAFVQSKHKGASIVYASPEAIRRYRTSRNLWLDIDRDPEALKGSDMYCYGMILFELLSRKMPWAEISTTKEIEQCVMNGIQPQVTFCDSVAAAINASKELQTIARLMISCWNSDPLTRPTAADVCKALEKFCPEKRQFVISHVRSKA